MTAKKTNNQKTKIVAREVDAHTEEIKRYIGSVTEDFQHKLSGVAEGVIILAEKVDRMNDKLDEHGRILNEHTGILNEHSRILNEHSRILDSHSEMIGTIAEDVSVVKDDISVIKSDLKRKVDYDEFASLAKRVSLIETKIRR